MYKTSTDVATPSHPDLVGLRDARALRDEAWVTSVYLVVHKGQEGHHSKQSVGMVDDTN